MSTLWKGQTLQERASARRERLVEAAVQLMGTVGVARLRARHVAGVPPGALGPLVHAVSANRDAVRLPDLHVSALAGALMHVFSGWSEGTSTVHREHFVEHCTDVTLRLLT